MTLAALIVAAGRGTRAGGDMPKQWRPLGRQRVIDHTLAAFAPFARALVVVHHPDDSQLAQSLREQHPDVILVTGDATRAGLGAGGACGA